MRIRGKFDSKCKNQHPCVPSCEDTAIVFPAVTRFYSVVRWSMLQGRPGLSQCQGEPRLVLLDSIAFLLPTNDP
jgi:hypothetical protein